MVITIHVALVDGKRTYGYINSSGGRKEGHRVIAIALVDGQKGGHTRVITAQHVDEREVIV